MAPGQKRYLDKKTACYGHFGRDDNNNNDFFPWEKTDKTDQLLAAVK